MRKKSSSYEGLQEHIRTLKLPDIEVWKNKYRDRVFTVSLVFPEFTSLCPKTGEPDFGCIEIEYVPDKYCVELKSFKHYLGAYRQIGIFYEHAINRILDDFVRACKPRSAKIKITFNPRGGIQTTVSRSYERRTAKLKK